MPMISRRSACAGYASLLFAGFGSSPRASLAGDPTFRVGTIAPNFSVADNNGRTLSLTSLRGKTVVLEWTNPDCPFVQKHYLTGSMQSLQAEAIANAVVWLTVSSAAPGNMGYLDSLEAGALADERKSKASAFLLDRDGAMLAAYGVNVALTMAVIDPQGVLAYHGAIDDRPTARPEDVKGAQNYVRLALAAVAAGQPVKPAQTRPYGCSAR